MESFEKLLEESVKIHGHLCAGQVIGVRMSMVGLEMIGISDPKGADRKKLYVLVEIDRCATDAIQSVTGCSLGKRSMRWLDLGIMAATFVNLETGKAVRITALEEAREGAKNYFPALAGKYERQLEAYRVMPVHELFRIQHVQVDLPPENMPGRPLRRVQCQGCGDWVQDCREIQTDGRLLCRGCMHGKYYTTIEKN
ncbi:MAG: FmdE family protein [Desulfocapsaceae bacterium]|nr:FmdE family protein [Desulfocapsaceae bacterium]